jgi:hypothetical protein
MSAPHVGGFAHTARAVLSALVLVLVGASVAGCGSGGASTTEPGADTTARLASVMVGSDTVLGPADVTAVNVIGLDLVTLATPLRTWWATFNDPDVDESAWLASAPQLLDAMRTTVSHIGQQLGPGRDPAVRATFTPYLEQWKNVLAALEAMQSAVRAGDLGAQQAATDDYNAAIAAMQRFDSRRVGRVIDAYGRDEAARALAAQGLDPSRYGL